jgi:diaminopimelate epimerase
MKFSKAHAYGNDFLYVAAADAAGRPPDALARELCDRHTGIGADGLILYAPAGEGVHDRRPQRISAGDGGRALRPHAMRLFNADGSPSEVSGNGVRGLAALLLRDEAQAAVDITIQTDAGIKRLARTSVDGSRQTFRAAMGWPVDLRRTSLVAVGEKLHVVVMTFGNPQAVVLGPLPDDTRFQRLGPAIERHEMFPARTNVEFAHVESPALVRILIWERGVGPTWSSGTGSCASLIAAAAFGGADRSADVIAPGGTQRVEWESDNVYLTGWAEVLFDGDWQRR